MASKRRRRRGSRPRTLRRGFLVAVLAALAGWWVGCRGAGHGAVVSIRIPEGASFSQVTDSLAAHHVVRAPLLFQVYAHLTGASRHVKPGTYGFRQGTGWDRVLSDLAAGREMTARLVVPEGWRLAQIAPRMARLTSIPEDSILALLRSPATVRRFRVPGPTMEGYLYPATYNWPLHPPVDTMLATMVRRYRKVWTPVRQARADSLGMDEREVVTLASIVEAEAKIPTDMPLISAVYHNRLRIGMPLQADPTVQYVLPQRHDRLLYSDIGSVAKNPYNTYAHTGLPPGPIGCPSERAMDAALQPAPVDYLYFVARPDGRSIFTRTLAQHNRAKAQVRALIAAESAAVARNPAAAESIASAAKRGTAPLLSPVPAAPGGSGAAPAGTAAARAPATRKSPSGRR